MRLMDLLPEHVLPLRTADLEISGVTDDPAELQEGFLFCTYPWTEGVRHWNMAAKRGASVLIVPTETSEADARALRDLEKEGIVVLGHPDITSLYARLALRFRSERPLFLAGVAQGPAGSSAASFLARIWASSGLRGQSLSIRELPLLTTIRSRERGSFERSCGGSSVSDALLIDELFTHAVVEVSEEDLESNTIDSLQLDVVVFRDSDSFAKETQGMAQPDIFLAEKVKYGGAGVIQADDVRLTRVAKRLRSRQAQLITFSTSGTLADLTLLAQEPNESGQLLIASIFGQTHQIQLPSVPPFRPEDILAAIGAAVASGVDVHSAAVSAESPESRLTRQGPADTVKVLRFSWETL